MKGTNFKAGERVRVTLVFRGNHTRRAIASPTGTFTVSFGEVQLGHCGGFIVRAVGSRGSTALFKRPLPACITQ